MTLYISYFLAKYKTKYAYMCIKRLNRLNTFKEHNESTSTWFGRTEQHDRGHVTPNKFPGPHNGCLYTRLLSKTKELLSFTVLSQIFVCGSILCCFYALLLGSPRVPCGFPRKKWVPFINMHNGRVNDVTYCDNPGKKWVPPC